MKMEIIAVILFFLMCGGIAYPVWYDINTKEDFCKTNNYDFYINNDGLYCVKIVDNIAERRHFVCYGFKCYFYGVEWDE